MPTSYSMQALVVGKGSPPFQIGPNFLCILCKSSVNFLVEMRIPIINIINILIFIVLAAATKFSSLPVPDHACIVVKYLSMNQGKLFKIYKVYSITNWSLASSCCSSISTKQKLPKAIPNAKQSNAPNMPVRNGL